MFNKIKTILFGKSRNPFSIETRQRISLIAFFAWIGLGADGLSSSAYGPEQSFLMLGKHTYLGLYLALATAITVFIISFAYNQVIELFPSGGGGYKVASRLVNPFAGLISGSALLLNYTLTIAVSFASAIDALFSLLPIGMQPYKVDIAIAGILILMYLNLRGMKESITVFLPIFLSFVLLHLFIIVYGVGMHANHLTFVVHNSWEQTKHLSFISGWFFVIALFLRSYSIGGGTYTGLEAVSNNVNNLAEPRVRTGKWTMFYMAVSLSLTAGGIILLYLLWNVHATAGETLNASVFALVLQNIPYHHLILVLILASEAGLLFVGANTGFFAGPAVLANMAIDGWAPRSFRNLSNRLIVQNGVLLFGIMAILIVIWSHGSVTKLVILYSLNVFITFTLSLLGLCIYWWKNRRRIKYWWRRLAFSIFGFTLCSLILIITAIEKFTQGAWLTVLMTGIVVLIGYLIKQHYNKTNKLIKLLDKKLTIPVGPKAKHIPEFDPQQPTAVFFIGSSIGEGMHTLLWAQRMFENKFKNFIFLSAGIVDVNSYESVTALNTMQQKVEQRLNYFIEYAQHLGIPAQAHSVYGTDHVQKLVDLAERVSNEVSSPIFFAAKLVLKKENWLTRLLHNETPVALQRYLHLRGLQMVILPVKL